MEIEFVARDVECNDTVTTNEVVIPTRARPRRFARRHGTVGVGMVRGPEGASLSPPDGDLA
jgi:hypothetical protein